jgi:UDP-N-acetylglucosamine 2-epimerase (non-hydrolysing)
VALVAGTRPEAIKLGPVISRLRDDPDLDVKVVSTGQHREILEDVLRAFRVRPDMNLRVMRPGQSLCSLAARAVEGLERAYARLQPDLVVVQGDTTTAFTAALAAFYQGVPVAHVEAGLRTGTIDVPFPEEANRRLVSVITRLHLAPTPWTKANLLNEGVDERSIVVTGNTVVDALRAFLKRPLSEPCAAVAGAIAASLTRPVVVVTTHRRENWGEPQARIAQALRAVASQCPSALFLVPLHPNPMVREVLTAPLQGLENVALCEPLRYDEMVHVLARSWMTITDSGGMQEEGCALGVPVLLLREDTERPEGVAAGIVQRVGTDVRAISRAARRLLTDRELRAEMAQASAVFGDGRASERTRLAIRALFGMEHQPPADFGWAHLEPAAQKGA